MLSTRHAADLLLAGGVIAYPTEGVFGLGCLPDDTAAVERILAIKNRAANKGLILIAASADQMRTVDTVSISIAARSTAPATHHRSGSNRAPTADSPRRTTAADPTPTATQATT